MEGHLTATRFAQKPLHHPAYSFAHVPKAARDLKGSSLQRITNREHFTKSMAEMLLLCKEAMRRRRSPQNNDNNNKATTNAAGSKPLSLEYIADRLDIDDPCFGYLVRTNENTNCTNNQQHWQKGMLQGFITVTTFTNWQRTFRWDSSHEAAFEFDTPEMREARLRGERVWDETNQLARELQKSVHMGDIWEEGVVWPRIAEISLLGGLGCGSAMIKTVIEDLERMKATGKANYDYVVLQATDNSIPFYESMGFVRVGAIMQDEVELRKRENDFKNRSSLEDEAVAEPVEQESPEKANAIALPNHIVTSDITTYTVGKAGTTLADVAKRLRVDVWDIVFLNAKLYPELVPSSRLLAGTMLHVPKKTPGGPAPIINGSRRATRTSEAETPQFYFAKENDTPRSIAKMFSVSCLDLVEANKVRLPGLVSSSRLKEGTKVKVSHLNEPDTLYKPYAHWSFPDDQFEEGEPGYMMALKLDKKRGNTGRDRPFLSSLAVPISDYEETNLLVPPSPSPERPAAVSAPPTKSTKKSKNNNIDHPNAPPRPKKPLGPYMMFATEQRALGRSDLEGLTLADSSKLLSEQWKTLSDSVRAKYFKRAEKARVEYQKAKTVYEQEMKVFLEKNPLPVEEPEPTGLLQPVSSREIKYELYNKVVKLKPGAITEGSEYKYWYVLTYIPDLKWCHLAPLEKVGTFDPDKPRVGGRPKWMLVDESLGKEVDISSSFCIPIKARFMKRTLDADKEEWDIIDDGTNPIERRKSFSRSSTKDDSSDSDSRSVILSSRPGSLIKPSVTRKRQTAMPPLIAHYPGETKNITVNIVGHRIYDASYDYPIIRPRGRPKGSKNKPKSPDSSSSLSRSSSVSSTTITGKKRGRPPVSGKKQKAGESRGTSSFRDSSEPSRKKPRAASPIRADPSSRPRRSAAPTFMGETDESPALSQSDKIPYQPRRNSTRVNTPTRSVRSSPKARESVSPLRSASSRVTRSSPCSFTSGSLPVESPRPTSKRWHPVRETRNGKSTPRARGRVGTPQTQNSRKLLAKTDRRVVRTPERSLFGTPTRRGTRSAQQSPGSNRPKRKAAPTFSLLEGTPRKRRALHL